MREPDRADHPKGYDKCPPVSGIEDLGRTGGNFEPGGKQGEAEAEHQIAESFQPMGKSFTEDGRHRSFGLSARNPSFHDAGVLPIRAETKKMKAICKACGTQFPESAEPPISCPICCDSRQFVPKSGQEWTTLEKLRTEHRNTFRQYEPNLIGIGTEPEFAIGQRALLLRTPTG